MFPIRGNARREGSDLKARRFGRFRLGKKLEHTDLYEHKYI